MVTDFLFLFSNVLLSVPGCVICGHLEKLEVYRIHALDLVHQNRVHQLNRQA
jgi:hypothetical protein